MECLSDCSSPEIWSKSILRELERNANQVTNKTIRMQTYTQIFLRSITEISSAMKLISLPNVAADEINIKVSDKHTF